MEIHPGIWGKSRGLAVPYPLLAHSLDAAMFAESLWDHYLTPSQQNVIIDGLGLTDGQAAIQARSLTAWWAGLHDLGKAIPGFQRLNKAAFSALLDQGFPDILNGAIIRHDRASHLIVPPLLWELWNKEASASRTAERVGQILGGHHGVFHPRIRDAVDGNRILIRNPGLGAELWDDQRRALVREIWTAVGKPEFPPQLRWDAALIITGIVVVADWLASQESFINRPRKIVDNSNVDSWVAHHLLECQADVPKAVERAGLSMVRWQEMSFEQAFNVPQPRPIQQSLLNELPSLVKGAGILLVTVPTGEGKTEAALAAARLMGDAAATPGLFVALPTMATADQMYRRVAQFAQKCVKANGGLTLAHSMAWMNDEYLGNTELLLDDELVDDEQAQLHSPTAVARWLLNRNRAFLAGLSVGTTDQTLAPMVKGKYTSLRLLGLTGKVLIIDEVHSYDAYMHALLRRLMHWMGVLRVPVVLLSATLSGELGRQLLADYLIGAGHRESAIPATPYPGWSFADATTGAVVARPVITSSTWDLAVDLHRVSTKDELHETDRFAVLQKLITAATQEGGCIAIVCNTVAQAQVTYRKLRDWFQALPNPPKLRLLHARFPAWRRSQLTAEVESWFGKNADNRPERAVLVATQVIEQSLDLDFDLVISDLAPLAMLLQRAGRCWRHPDRPTRPRWSTGPRISVLIPTADGSRLQIPRPWLGVYSTSILLRTEGLLTCLDGPIAVPSDVQKLIDDVYADEFSATDYPDKLRDADLELWGENAAAQSVADLVTVPTFNGMRSLADWSNADIDDELLSTRLGAESQRVLCCYIDESGNRWLRQDGREFPLLETGSRPNGRFTRTELRQLMANTIPVRPGAWTQALSSEHAVPDQWTKNGVLRSLILLPFRRMPDGSHRAQTGDRNWVLDMDEGLSFE